MRPSLKKKPVFDINKNYTWQPDDEFVISGLELDTLYKATRAIISTPEAQMIFMAKQTFDIAQTILKEGVEEGIIKEMPQAAGEKLETTGATEIVYEEDPKPEVAESIPEEDMEEIEPYK